MKRIVAFVVVAALLFVMLVSAPPARAASYLYLIGDHTGTCDNTGFLATGTVTLDLPTDVELIATYYLDGVVLGTESGSSPAVQGTYPSWWFWSFSPPLSSSTYTFSARAEFSVDGVSVGVATLNGRCEGGVFFGTGTWSDGEFAGPSVPVGFVLKTITCDVAVFDTPGGSPVGNNRLTAGQTFFVSPESTQGLDGEAWSQVYVSSYVSPWIPTRCIGQ